LKSINKSILQACIFQGWEKFIVGLLIPILVLFQQERGFSLIQIGFNMALFSGAVIVLEIPSGILADLMGQKRVYLFSISIKALAMLTLMITKEHIWMTTAIALWGAGRAFGSGSMESIFINNVSDEGTDRKVEKLISSTQVAIPVGLALGALLGGFLPDLHIIKILFIDLSDYYSLNFFTAMFLYIFLGGFFILLVSDSRVNKLPSTRISTEQSADLNNHKSIEGPVSLSLRTIKSSHIFLIIMITTLAWGFSFSGLETFWQPRLHQIIGEGGSTFIFGLLTNGYFLAGAIGGLLSWPLCRLLGNKPFIFLFTQRLVLGGMFLVLSEIMNLGWFSAVYIGLFLFNGISNPVEMSILNREIPSESRATLLSVISFVLQTGGLIGSLAGGFISESKGIGFTWQIGAVILIISGFAYLRVYGKKKNAGVKNEI